MYAYFNGRIADLGPDTVTVDVAGVGYLMMCSLETRRQLSIGQNALLYAHLHITDDAHTLFGFISKEERAMFLRLISVTRVGPKLALSALSTMTPSQLAAAIVTENEPALARISGMGKKTAQRVILELKEKIATEEAIVPGNTGAALDKNEMQEAAAALVALGYDAASAAKAVAGVEEQKTEDIIKAALKRLAK